MLTELLRLTSELATSETVRAVVLTGAGEKAFVAGADIAAMAQMMPPEALRFAELGHRLMDSIEALPQPLIAAVNGFALGGGMELAMPYRHGAPPLPCAVVRISTSSTERDRLTGTTM